MLYFGFTYVKYFVSSFPEGPKAGHKKILQRIAAQPRDTAKHNWNEHNCCMGSYIIRISGTSDMCFPDFIMVYR